jgi:peptidoglycan/LPS O-acetylase OafA/YrhL
MKEVRALTSLRGVAAMWVFMFHLDLKRPMFPPGLLAWVPIGRGYIAVDLFFVLSGFVMALTYRDSFLARPFMAAYPDFLLRRVARVMPLNAVIVIVLALAVWLGGRAGDTFLTAQNPWAVLTNLFLVQDWDLFRSIDKPAWSVSVEMAVYLAYPALLVLAWSRRWWWLGLLAGIAALFWLALVGQGSVSQGLLFGDFIRGFTGFTFGLLCCRIFKSGGLPGGVERLDLAFVIAFWGALILFPADLPAILLCPFLILSLSYERGVSARLLNLGPLHYLGQISYSIYLVHYAVLGGLNLLPIRSNGVYLVTALILTLGISAATYLGIERPARRWIAPRRKGRRSIERFARPSGTANE